jgi:hypothetical protein
MFANLNFRNFKPKYMYSRDQLFMFVYLFIHSHAIFNQGWTTKDFFARPRPRPKIFCTTTITTILIFQKLHARPRPITKNDKNFFLHDHARSRPKIFCTTTSTTILNFPKNCTTITITTTITTWSSNPVCEA